MDPGAPIFTQHKHILSAQWTAGGQDIIALLSDGEWGIWHFAKASPLDARAPKSAFALHGYVDANIPSSVKEADPRPEEPGRSHSSLTPTTPNSRRVKKEFLVLGEKEVTPDTPPRGGISVHQSFSAPGKAIAESVVLWYNNKIYNIPQLQELWMRLAKKSSGVSLLAPGLSCIQGVDLLGETLTSVAQLPIPNSYDKHVKKPGRSNLVMTAEHKLLFLSYAVPVRATTAGPESRISAFKFSLPGPRGDQGDEELLKQGALDLSGLGRLLDNMNDVRGRGSETKLPARKDSFDDWF
jgi:hypothetical protein